MNVRDDCFSFRSGRLESFKVDATSAIRFKLVRTESDLENNALDFKPEMAHQIFGESESIFGYKDLTIDIFCTAANMVTYVGTKYSEKINPVKYDGIQADDFMKMLAEYLQPGFLTNLDLFTKAIHEDVKFKPFGELIHCYNKSSKESGEQRTFEIYFVSEPSQQFVDYHERLQPFLIFFVDAASYISVDDRKWSYYLTFEKYRNSNNITSYAFVGYMTVYNFYAYPDKLRPRISQVLVMPPFQRQGHGTVVLQEFYRRCWDNPAVLDVSVEDPSNSFQRIRDYVDCLNCSKLPSFQPQFLRRGFSQQMIDDARMKLKISRKQARKVYEILRLKNTNCFDDKEFKDYRKDVKRRLNAPFQKNSRNTERLCKTLKPHELAAALSSMSDEKRVEILEEYFQSCVNEYRLILDRLDVDF